MPPNATPSLDVTVLDLSDEATVLGARLLAELGAHVIRVEHSGGDAIRHRAPFLHNEPGIERSLAHLLYNAGKRSVALDLDRKEAWGVVDRLLPQVDVVIAPLAKNRHATAFFDRLGSADPGSPGLVDVVFRRSATADIATDLIATAAGGLLCLNGFPEDPPNYPAGELAYKEASLAAAEGALALVTAHHRTGRAGTITVSLQEAVNFTTIQTANANFLHWRAFVPSRHTPVSPFTTFKSRDGRWTSFTVHPPNWPRFVEWIETVLGTSELRESQWEDQRFRTEQREYLGGLTSRLCASLDQAALLREGQSRGLLVLPVNSVAGIADDPHLMDRGFFQDVWHAQLEAMVKLPRSAFLSQGRSPKTAPAPSLGQDTEAILRGVAGCSADEVDRFFEDRLAHGPRTVTSHPVPVSPGRMPSRARPAPAHRPLDGVRILDFGWAIAGPLGTRLLADLGADIIKVESEYRLDPIRYIGVQPEGAMSWNTNGQFNDCNTGKRSLTLNVNTPEGIAIARALAAKADVVTSNYTPDRMDRWGLGYEALRRLKPDIIVANMAVMGIRGPHKDWRSYGSGIVAMCGLADLTGFPGRDPIGLGTLHTDFTVPYFGAAQIMTSLLERDRTGEGQYLELSQYEASVHLLDTELVEHLNNGRTHGRLGNRSLQMTPHGVFPAEGRDRWIAIACRDDTDWQHLCAMPGLEALAGIADRRQQEDPVEAILSAWTCERDAWDAAAELQCHGIPASPVEDLSDFFGRDAAMRADYREVSLPAGVTAMVQEQPITWDGERLTLIRAPEWGEHTEEILRHELGFDGDRIAELAAAGVLY
jgi:crotonobetainyl-CoA:carnitine CoA-transferase CaiB-like acyl-CoA transferase